jgi:cobalamin biosynthesis protein CobT
VAGRIRNRKELRADYDAAERRQADAETPETEDEVEEEDEDEEEGEEGEEAEADEEVGEDEDEEAAPKKKKKKKVVAKVVKPKRTRAAKVVRMKVVWGVFSNSNQRVAVYEYPKKKEADEHAARLTVDKKSTHFVQPVKEPIEEKKEK